MIGAYAFEECGNLQIIYLGTREEWEKIDNSGFDINRIIFKSDCE